METRNTKIIKKKAKLKGKSKLPNEKRRGNTFSGHKNNYTTQ